MIINLSITLFIWTIAGLIITAYILECNENFKYLCSGLEYLSFKWLYETLPYTKLGTALLCIFLNLLSPLVTIGYWIYRGFNALFIDESKK